MYVCMYYHATCNYADGAGLGSCAYASANYCGICERMQKNNNARFLNLSHILL